MNKAVLLSRRTALFVDTRLQKERLHRLYYMTKLKTEVMGKLNMKKTDRPNDPE